MRLLHLDIQGYRSLYEVSLSPSDMSVLVGPNNAGKTNFVEALDFLAETYRHGLEVAINRKGGVENITHRRMRRTRLDLSFDILVQLDASEIAQTYYPDDPEDMEKGPHPEGVFVRHQFSFHALGQAIEADYEVVEERAEIWVLDTDNQSHQLLTITRTKDARTFDVNMDAPPSLRALISPFDYDSFHDFFANRTLSPGRLFVEAFPYANALQAMVSSMANARLYQLVPLEGRSPGVPTPNAEIEHHGRNLPAMVAHMKRHDPRAWATVIAMMRRIIPGLVEVKTDFTPDRRLALQFVENGVRRAWSSEDVSDGTIQSLALFAALLDRRTPLVLIEEPENSIHPWILRNFVDACRDAGKQVIVTTHSPVLISYVSPQDLYLVSRSEGRTEVQRLADKDPKFQRLWESGQFSLFDLIDSGAIPESVPAGPE